MGKGGGGGAGGGLGKNEMLSDVGRVGVTSVLEVQSLFSSITENWICSMTRHDAQPTINILLTRNFPFDSDDKQRSHPLMILLHCLWAKSNNRMHGQFECDVTWFCLCSDFVRSHVRCSCSSIVCLHFHVVQMKQVGCKMSTKNLNNYK